MLCFCIVPQHCELPFMGLLNRQAGPASVRKVEIQRLWHREGHRVAYTNTYQGRNHTEQELMGLKIFKWGECYLDHKRWGKSSTEELVKSEDGSVRALVWLRIKDIVSLGNPHSPPGHSCSKNSNLPSHCDIFIKLVDEELKWSLKRLSMSRQK